MSTTRRIRLNPCDRLFLGHHQLQVRSAGRGNIAFMMVDLDADIARDTMRDALARAMSAHPVTIAQLRSSLPMCRPYWRIPRSPASVAADAATRAHIYEDLRDAARWQDRLEELLQRRSVPAWDIRSGPQVRLDHYALPGGRTRLCLHWPHALMDGEGAQWFLAALGDTGERHPKSLEASQVPRKDRPQQLQEGLCSRSCDLPPDGQAVDILKGRSLGRRWRLFRRGMASQRAQCDLKIRPLPTQPSRDPAEHHLLHRHWNAEQVRRMQATARRLTPPGPALYARFLAAAVIRALHGLYNDLGAQTDAYMITLPMRVGISQPHSNMPNTRGVPGNYLITPMICCTPRQTADRRVLAEAIFGQVRDYLHNELDLAQWAVMRAATLIHGWFYPLIFKLSMSVNAMTSGFSYYTAIQRPLRSIAGATVTNCWGGGPVPMPPGWNPVFSMFDGRLNLSLTYLRPAIPDDLAARYADLIEAEAFGSP